MKRALYCLVIMSLAGPGHGDPIDELRDVIAQRLALMTDVARYKWNAQLPVADLEREAALLPLLIQSAVDAGLDPVYADRVVRAQITAARMQQERLMAQWRMIDERIFDGVPDLVLVTRPAITAATTRLLATLYSNLCALRPDLQWGFPPPGIDEPAWTTATAALLPAPEGACAAR